jgi:hypothetical protein
MIAGMTPDPKACQAPMFAVEGYRDSRHRHELCKKHPVARTTDRAPPQPGIRIIKPKTNRPFSLFSGISG